MGMRGSGKMAWLGGVAVALSLASACTTDDDSPAGGGGGEGPANEAGQSGAAPGGEQVAFDPAELAVSLWFEEGKFSAAIDDFALY